MVGVALLILEARLLGRWLSVNGLEDIRRQIEEGPGGFAVASARTSCVVFWRTGSAAMNCYVVLEGYSQLLFGARGPSL